LSELEDKDIDFPDEMLVEGKKYSIKIPKCCTPRQSDKVRAFKTKDGKIVIHRIDCPNVYTCDMSKEVQLKALQPEIRTYPVRIDVKDRVGILGELLSAIAKEHQLVDAVNTRLGKDGRLIITMDIRKNPELDIGLLIDKLKKHDSVINVFIEDQRHTQRFLSGKGE
jgi:GTP diphosphokinase / guanosine-3',5'-bis(diphosphate) 3'-diphosphatase